MERTRNCVGIFTFRQEFSFANLIGSFPPIKLEMREDDYLINARPQAALQTYKRVQIGLFSYSFVITMICIVFISLFSWQIFKYPIPMEYQVKLTPWIANNCPKPLELYITPDDYTERRNKLATAMERESILAFIAEPSASMTYFTGTQWKLTERAFLFVKTQTDYFWIVPAFELGKAREYIPNGINATNIHVWQEAESPYDVLANVLQLNETIVNRIAVAPETRLFIENSISNMKSVQVVFGGPIETNIRMIKTSREINIMRCANLATKQVLKVLVETGMIPLGVVQSKLKEHVDRALKAVGLTNVWSLVLFGANAAFPHGTKQDLVLGDGDYVLLDIGGELNGYQSDISRTFRVGKGTAEIDEAWKVVQQAQAKAFAAIKAGVNCSTIDSVAREVVEARFPNAFTHRLGHGIGIQGHEDPYFVQGNSVMLAEGMTLSVEPGIYLPGKFGIRLEDIVVVTKDGCEVFGSRPMSVTKPVE